MDKSVACVIVNYNDYIRTLKLVQTIIDYSIISHVIVIDNSSTDESQRVLMEYKHEKYLLIQSSINGGYGYGNNIGIRKADELGDEYTIIANPDVFFTKECIQQLILRYNSTNNCGIITAKETFINRYYAWKYTSGLDDVLSASLVFNKLLKKRYYSKDYFTGKDFVYVDVVPGCFLLTKTKTMISCGMYDEEFFLYEEEKVIYKKLNDYGIRGVVDLNASFEHRHMSGKTVSIKKNMKSKCTLLKSKALFLKKYRGFNKLQIALSKMFFLLCLLEMFVYSICRKWSRP